MPPTLFTLWAGGCLVAWRRMPLYRLQPLLRRTGHWTPPPELTFWTCLLTPHLTDYQWISCSIPPRTGLPLPTPPPRRGCAHFSRLFSLTTEKEKAHDHAPPIYHVVHLPSTCLSMDLLMSLTTLRPYYTTPPRTQILFCNTNTFFVVHVAPL